MCSRQKGQHEQRAWSGKGFGLFEEPGEGQFVRLGPSADRMRVKGLVEVRGKSVEGQDEDCFLH